jgi:hypothetical protein
VLFKNSYILSKYTINYFSYSGEILIARYIVL